MPIVDSIPQTSSNLPTTKTGFILREESPSTSMSIRAFNRAKLHLSEKGFGPWVQPDSVFITQEEAKFGNYQQAPMVCDVRSITAAECIAKGTHRLSTPEEIQDFRHEQIERERVCADITAKMPGNNDPKAAAKLMADAIAESLTAPERKSKTPKEKEN